MLLEETKQYSVDCTRSEKGLTAGLVCNVYTLISLIVYFSLRKTQKETAFWCLTVCEVILYSTSIWAMVVAAVQMRNLAYCVHRLSKSQFLMFIKT